MLKTFNICINKKHSTYKQFQSIQYISYRELKAFNELGIDFKIW